MDKAHVAWYTRETATARTLYDSLVTSLRNIKADQKTEATNAATITSNTTTLAAISSAIPHLTDRQKDMQAIPNATSGFI